jgi:hypothetical protein
MTEAVRESEVVEVPEELLQADADTWENAGLEKEGPVGFTIDEADIEGKKVQGGRVIAKVALETSIIARQGKKLDVHPKFWTRLSLEPAYLRKFKNLVAAAGVRLEPGTTANYREMARAIKGKTVFGVIQHKSFKNDNGETIKFAQFTNRFGKSFDELKS